MLITLQKGSVLTLIILTAFCTSLAVGFSISGSGLARAQDAPPAQPTGLTVSVEEFHSITVAWDDPQDDSITGYQVLRRFRDGDTYGDGQGAREFVAVEDNTGAADTEYTDNSVAPGTRYVYRVKARNTAGLSDVSNYARAETPGPAAQPTGLSVTSASHESVTLAWDDPSDDSITGYRVLRRSRDGDTYGDGQGAAEFVAIEDDTGTADTEYTNESVTPETRYVYRVEARNPAGLSERSSYANVETPVAPEPEPTPGPTPEPDPQEGETRRQQGSSTTKDSGGDGNTARQQETSSDAGLSSLSVNGTAIPGVDPDTTEYTLDVGNEVSLATLVAQTRHPMATVAIITLYRTDLEGINVDLEPGRPNTIELRVTAEDGVASQVYTLTINRGSAVATGWNVLKDLDDLLGSGSDFPGGIWSDGTHMWVSGGDDLKLYAYLLATKELDSDRDIGLHSDNAGPKGIWSDGETMWVVDSADSSLYAYNLLSGERDSSKDFTGLGDADADYYDTWSDGETIWLSDKTGPVIEAFDMETGDKVPELRYTHLEDSAHDHVAGIWSDGATMLVVSNATGREYIWGYHSPQSGIDLDRDLHYFNLSAPGNLNPGAIWADGETLWVSDTVDGKIYSYNMRESANTDLRSITVDGAEIPGVVPDATEHLYRVANSTSRITVAAAVRHPESTVSILTLDADGNTEGHQVDLRVGGNSVPISVTAADGTTNVNHTLTINRASTAITGWAVTPDLEDLLGSGSEFPGGIWSDGTYLWASGGDDLTLYAYVLATGERYSDRDITLHSDNGDPKGIWSDGDTIWVLDNTDRKLYAYTLESGARNETEDFGTFGDDDDDYYGVWSDGETVWLSNGNYTTINNVSIGCVGSLRIRFRRQNFRAGLYRDGTVGAGPHCGHVVRRRDHVGSGPRQQHHLCLRLPGFRVKSTEGLPETDRSRQHQPARHLVGRRDHVGIGQRGRQNLFVQHACLQQCRITFPVRLRLECAGFRARHSKLHPGRVEHNKPSFSAGIPTAAFCDCFLYPRRLGYQPGRVSDGPGDRRQHRHHNGAGSGRRHQGHIHGQHQPRGFRRLRVGSHRRLRHIGPGRQ